MHLRANEVEGDVKAEAARQSDVDERGHQHDPAADHRAMTAVGAGAVTSLDAGGARSLQRMAGNAAFTAAVQREATQDGGIDGSSVAGTISGSGRPLDAGLQSSMGRAYGADFSGVQVHDDAGAHQSASAVQARAYTVGNDIVLGAGVDAASSEGQKTIAHELTHVVQQSAGPVDGSPAAGGVSVSSPSDRFEQEAESNAEKVTRGGFADVATAGVSSSGLQREAEDATLQREAAPATEDDHAHEEETEGE